MSRSLLLAFIMSLILHALLAQVELNIFKRPLPARNVAKILTMDLVKPKPVKKPSVTKKPLIVIKNPEKRIKGKEHQKKLKLNTKASSEVKEKKGIQEEKPRTRKKSLKKAETLAHLQPVDRSAPQSFFPDMVDIPTALPKRKDVLQSAKEKESTYSSINKITFATPNYKKNSPPPYPLLARRKNYQGTVLLEVLVRKDGTVGSIRLSKSSGHETLDRAAIEGVKGWLFYPAKRGDEFVEMWVRIPIRFQLK